ncbi:MAG TPA: hypothetical protein VEY05_14125, partial [Beijerinckiaceae bacterium]|nr:hypothetical protein [Beijerinckiaceae bacterium]
VHRGFLDEGQLIRDAHRLAAIPGTIVQGRYDVVTPATTAWDLHKAWPGAAFHLVDDAGHASSEPGILHRLVAATDAYASSESTPPPGGGRSAAQRPGGGDPASG